jgi:predicted helicase
VNWRDYEIFITRHFQRLFPEASILHNVRRTGVISKVERQIDILIEGKVAGFNLSIIVDCKYFGKKVDVKDVDEFLGYLHDLRASKGVLITNHGYSDAAYNRAMYDTRDVEIRIIGIDDLERFQGFIAIPAAKHSEYLKKLIWIAEKMHKLTVIYDATGKPLSMPQSNT